MQGPGLLERAVDALERIARALEAANGSTPGAGSFQHAAAMNGYNPAPQQPQSPPPPPQTYQQPQSPPPPPPAPPGVTADQITALITPHVGNPAIKQALGDAMRQMGINALPEAQPHQYAEMYSRFQAVIAQYTGGVAPQQASASII